ncbi:Di-haem cytochrome c peroxidase [Modicisalibacter ilicicola DSM 19980]|uniref:Di-haem cytochrome c peroxidase n=1 Tax=Modicisalibacter ilicicola DSM 19980 TaxID=1121942 RepID=A0A1M4ZV16_9GAMM|nr:Di-haem cytochrome c peroxidase [Halomonas ilicicola DSM 19980]
MNFKRRFTSFKGRTAVSALAGTLLTVSIAGAVGQATAQCGANPCAGKNPCASQNPCATSNPCASDNPCATSNPCAGANPCATKNPCAGVNPCATKNPCAVKRPPDYMPGYSESGNNPEELLARGETLFNDTELSSNGLACASCHGGDQRYQPTFEQAYPHQVAMGLDLYGMNEVHADEMVQICMVNPMAADPLEWGSMDLAALAAYVVNVQRGYSGPKEL